MTYYIRLTEDYNWPVENSTHDRVGTLRLDGKGRLVLDANGAHASREPGPGSISAWVEEAFHHYLGADRVLVIEGREEQMVRERFA